MEENSTSTGSIRHAMCDDFDLVFGSYYLRQNQAKFLSYTRDYRLDSTVAVCARSAAFSPIEKLLRPFNEWLFMALLAILTFGFCSMYLLSKVRSLDDASFDTR